MTLSKTDWDDESSLPKDAWANSGVPANASWEPTSEFFDATTYDDATVSYDDPLVFYNGYSPSVATEDDVEFDIWSDSGAPAKNSWVDTT